MASRRLFFGSSGAASAIFASVHSSFSSCILTRTQCEQTSTNEQIEKPRSRIIFLGTGSSSGCPRPLCPMIYSNNDPYMVHNTTKDKMLEFCKVSVLASQGDPKYNRNYRNNPCLLIANYDGETPKHIVIDAGKTFREAAIRWLPHHGITSLDGVILTHEHADATFGLDDVRGFQLWNHPKDPNEPRKAVSMPLYLSKHCLDDISKRFTWLFPEQQPAVKPVAGKPVVDRHVASLDVQIFESFQSFDAQGVQVIPLPVMHGEDLVSFGFAFTLGKTNVVYLSDISRMLPETMDFIKNKLPPTDVLIVDALHPVRPNAVHFEKRQALEIVREIQPKQTFFVGMNCDSFLPHDEENVRLRKLHGNVQLAHDGLEILC